MLKSFFFAAASLLDTALLCAGNKPNTADLRQVAATVGRLLEQGHYSRWKLGPEMSARILETYLEDLDYDKAFLTQGDVNQLSAQYGANIGERVLLGDLGPAKAIYDIFKARVEERIAKVHQLLWKDYNFTSNRFVDLDRRKKRWPANVYESDSLWTDRIEGELLQEKLNKFAAADSGPKVVARRYDGLLKGVEDRGEEDIDEIFLNAVAESYDPHSEYMGRSNLESFEISMRLSLIGIGAELRSEDGYAKIQRLVPGGPAERSGKMSAGDRIVAVAQGENPFVDVRDMNLDKVVELIRGKKGTVVRLQVLPAGAADPSKRRVVALVRDTVKLTDEEAKAEIIDRVLPDGGVRRLGWISLPLFYQDPVKFGTGKSASRDVAALLNRLNKEKIQGLIVDLRSNGGGSLDEAVKMSGLFINQGPVVQVKDFNGSIDVLRDHEGKALYTRTHDCPCRQTKRLCERDFCCGDAGLWACPDCWRLKHFRQRDRPDDTRTGAIYALTWLILGCRSLKTDRAEVLPGGRGIDAAERRYLRCETPLDHGQCRVRRKRLELSACVRRHRIGANRCGRKPQSALYR